VRHENASTCRRLLCYRTLPLLDLCLSSPIPLSILTDPSDHASGIRCTWRQAAWYVRAAVSSPGLQTFCSAFPIVVKCHSQEDAERVNMLQGIFGPAGQLHDPGAQVVDHIAKEIRHSSAVATTFPNGTKFQIVVYGHKTGIYLAP